MGASKVRPFEERYARMAGARVELLRDQGEHRIYIVQAKGSEAHEVTAIATDRGYEPVSCDCAAFHYHGDPEGCVHYHKLGEWLMENELIKTNGTGMAALPRTTTELRTQEQATRDIIRTTYARGATDEELDFISGYCRTTGLNLFAGHVCVMFRNVYNKATRSNDRVLTIFPTIHGVIYNADRTGLYDGITDQQWCGPDGVWRDVWLSDDNPAAARCKVWKKGVSQPFVGQVTWKSYAQYTDEWVDDPQTGRGRKTGRKTLSGKWADSGPEQLMKCAINRGLRLAFPQTNGVGDEWRKVVATDVSDIREHIVYDEDTQPPAQTYDDHQATDGEYQPDGESEATPVQDERAQMIEICESMIDSLDSDDRAAWYDWINRASKGKTLRELSLAQLKKLHAKMLAPVEQADATQQEAEPHAG